MGWSFPCVSSQGSDFNFDFQASQTREHASRMVEGGAPPLVSQMADDCGTDPAGYLTEGPALIAPACRARAIRPARSCCAGHAVGSAVRRAPLGPRSAGGRLF
jgi:hypothetical protein